MPGGNVSARLMVACFCFVIAATPPILLTLLTQVTDDTIASVVPPWHEGAADIAAQLALERLVSVRQRMEAVLHVTPDTSPCVNRTLPSLRCNATNVTNTTELDLSLLRSERRHENCSVDMCSRLNATMERVIRSDPRLAHNHLVTMVPLQRNVSEPFTNDTFTLVEVTCVTHALWTNHSEHIDVGTVLRVPNAIASTLFGWNHSNNISSGWFPFRHLNLTHPLKSAYYATIFGENITGEVTNVNGTVIRCQWQEESLAFLQDILFLQSNGRVALAMFPSLSRPLSTDVPNYCQRAMMDDLVLQPALRLSLPSLSHLNIIDVSSMTTAPAFLTDEEISNRTVFCCREGHALTTARETEFCGPDGSLPIILRNSQPVRNRAFNDSMSLSTVQAALSTPDFTLYDDFLVTTISVRLKNFNVGITTFSILLVGLSQSTAEGFEGSQATSVIVGVSISAAAIVMVLSLLHYVFHPLKVIGSVLRGCADINLNGLEKLTPSIITEILDIQVNVDMLVQHMAVYGKYMPDKSQLQTLLGLHGKLKDFAETDAKIAPVMQNKVFGAIPHSVTVNVEYRSRLRPDVNRSIEDMSKRTTFAFMYSPGDDLFKVLLEQVRNRLNERVGEPLQLRDKGKNYKKGVELSETKVLSNAVDVMTSIEQATNATLNLIAIKTSVKDFTPYLTVVLSIADVAAVGLVITAWLPVRRLDVQRAALATAFAVFTKIFFNIMACLYLQRRFVTTNNDYATWMTTAMQEAVVSIMAGGLSVMNMRLLFSHTRFRKLLRFNAPYSPEFRRLIVKYATTGYVFGNTIPLFAMVYVAVSYPEERTVRVVMAFIFCSASLLSFLSQTIFQRAIQAVQAARERRRQKLMKNADGKAIDDEDSDEESDREEDMELQTAKVRIRDENSAIYLGLSERHATILCVALHDAEHHFEGMDSVEIQLLLGKFLSYVFTEAKVANGLVLGVHGTQVRIAFNCHHLLSNHLEAAYNCFLAIERNVEANMTTWCPDDVDRPKVVGAMISDPRCVVGYAGTLDARSFQHLGPTAALLDILSRLGQFYGARLLVNAPVCSGLESAISSNANAPRFAARELDSIELPPYLGSVGTKTNNAASNPKYRVRVFEVVKDMTPDHLGTSRSVFTLACGTSTNSTLANQYGAMYPEDMPLQGVVRWAGFDTVPRHLTVTGLRLYYNEFQQLGERKRPTKRRAEVEDDQRQHPMIHTLLQKDSFQLYFTDI